MILKILDAKYGHGSKNIDVSNILNTMISKNQLYISKKTNLNMLFTDPCPNYKKSLHIKYSYNGNNYEGNYNENRSKLNESIFLFNRDFKYQPINSLSSNDSIFINYLVNKNKNCNFLLFGDIDLYENIKTINNLGNIVLITDSKKDFNNNPCIIHVDYNTKCKDWDKLLHDTEKLNLNLPDIVKNINWDIIFIAGPKGYDRKCPGRMKSIYNASRFIGRGTNVIILDSHRKIEKIYTEIYIEKHFVSKKYIGSIMSWYY